jgi:digeranylgeranylglycerophospholipid reductase
MYSVAIIGGGPVGLRAAELLAEEGLETVVLEEHSAIGKPVNCAGLVSKAGLAELGINPQECILNTINGAKIFSPGGEELDIEEKQGVAYVLDREKFDKMLYKQAVKAGAEVRFNTKMINVRNETIFVQHKNRGEIIKAKIIVGADGVQSKVRELMGLKVQKENLVQAMQIKARGEFDEKKTELYFGDFAKNFFSWVIPENREIARIGLATSSFNAPQALQEFTEKKGFQKPFFGKVSALIPIGPPLEKNVEENMMLAGDAAFQTKATTGGGIVTGLTASKALAETISRHFKSKGWLKAYEKKTDSLNRDLKMHWKIRQYLNSLDNQKMDGFFRKMKKARVEEFLEKEGNMDFPSRFIGKAWAKPRMWGFLPELVKFLKG